VIDEVRSQVAVKRSLWREEGEFAKQKLEGLQEAEKETQEQKQIEGQDREPEEARR